MPRSAELRLHWRFDEVTDPVTEVADASGEGRTGTAIASSGGRVEAVRPGHDGVGGAVRFPAVCIEVDGRCPRAAIQGPADPALDPGTAPFTFGVRVRVERAELTPAHGSNLMQKGSSLTSQWKLQIDDARGGRPSCVVRAAGGAPFTLVRARAGVADGRWHEVVCRRTAGELQILVDGEVVGAAAVAPGLVVAPAGMPVVAGAANAAIRNDQFHGELDEVFFAVG
ncbi:LamG-like jellyroll fold domain-containing protein [Thermomonospora catenispora]|uniref:LamG-like jellyroll fold domain-containing protein n=1 Tax=Thermomonospora catenispora TaxID=2493090 RepID=UPI001124C8C7|nr:LamG-like jellyroll fold domain-containing protein [Thermomonospora catenispora]TNY37214.1 LamG domain-containing protein [Thermomonospora catenispora]